MQFKQAFDEIELTTLSPNLKEINNQVRKTKEQLDLRHDDSKISLAMASNNYKNRMKQGSMQSFVEGPTFDVENIMTAATDQIMYPLSTRSKDTSGRKIRYPP